MALDEARRFGRGIAFPPHLDEDGRWAMSTGDGNVRESIRIILLTRLGERLMRPAFGSELGTYLFQPNIPTTRRLIQETIERALNAWEPRVLVESIDVEPDPTDPQTAIATLAYRLRADQTAGRVTVAVQLGG